MELNEFIDKYLGKQVEYHSYGGGALFQCVDLVNFYIKEVLGLTPIIGANAKDFPSKYNKNEFDYIINTPEAIIKKGDIPIWNGNVGGGAGHIAIAREDGSINTFKSVDQNWSQKERVTLETHNYNNVIGWLRPKVQGGDANMDEITKLREERDKNWTMYQAAKAEADQNRQDRDKWYKALTDVLGLIGIALNADNPQETINKVQARINELSNQSGRNEKAEALIKAIQDVV